MSTACTDFLGRDLVPEIDAFLDVRARVGGGAQQGLSEWGVESMMGQ